MSKNKLSLPQLAESTKEKVIKANVIKELQQNIDLQLEILQDRLSQDTLADFDDVKVVLENIETIIYDAYSTPGFNTSMYKNFSVLTFEYQKLALRLESAQVEEKINDLNNKTKTMEKRSKNMEGSLKNLLATIIGLFLTFTIIPTAIAGIERISSQYILSFIATLVLFGIIMISFIYIINNIEISGLSWLIIVITLLVTGALWYISWKLDIGVKDNEILIDNSLSTCYTEATPQ